ncbi:MAG: DUF2892 domain-containing protein [Gammaproteobacteria bacterium]|nr:DUF2892 domain-containing protein [Gammaproteobacteria bacterium]
MCNLNIYAQTLRIIFGLILISLVWLAPLIPALSPELVKFSGFGWLGIIPLISGIVAFCPIYAVLGVVQQCNKK